MGGGGEDWSGDQGEVKWKSGVVSIGHVSSVDKSSNSVPGDWSGVGIAIESPKSKIGGVDPSADERIFEVGVICSGENLGWAFKERSGLIRVSSVGCEEHSAQSQCESDCSHCFTRVSFFC